MDLNRDLIPDDCQCNADFTGDGKVAVHDLLALIAVWSVNSKPVPIYADLNRDHVVDIADLLLLIGAWGDCPDFIALDVTGACCPGQSSICWDMNEVACGVILGHYIGDNTFCDKVNCQDP